ncbi:MAG: sodium:proton antiporter [Arcobacteraceae bacterium]|nr:sodium:proton antiporter [Arcobacteraceae bacterium]
MGDFIISGYSISGAVIGSVERSVTILGEVWVAKTIVFALLVGSVIVLISASGGVEGFIEYISRKKKIIKSKRSALFLTYIIGLIIFVESSITALIAGTVSRPLTDKFKVSREKLAYVCDSTSAPVCSLIPLNAWGALLIGLITTQISAGVISGDAVYLLIQSIPFNFYSIVTLIVVFIIVYKDKDFGAMNTAEIRALKEGKLIRDGANPIVDEEVMSLKTDEGINPAPLRMILPISVLILMMPIGLYLSGDGNMLKGSGTTAIFYSVLTTLLFCGIYYVGILKIFTLNIFMKHLNRGAGAMFQVAAVLVFAFAIGDITVELGTGNYLAHLSEGFLSPALGPVVIFILASFISFSTGTSWGTFSIMIPIALQMGVAIDAHLLLMIGAVVSGGVFGDHCSPISDTSIVSSMAAGSDHIDHVNTQLPYALFSGVIAIILFTIFGVLLT